MKKQILLYTLSLLFCWTINSQTSNPPKFSSISTYEFQYKKNQRIKTNYTNIDGDIFFYSDNKIIHTPYSQYDIQFNGFTRQVLFAKESDSSGFMVVNQVPAGFKIYTLQYRKDSFHLDSILPDSQNTLRLYFTSGYQQDRSLFIGSFLHKNSRFWTVNVHFESTGNMATRAADEVNIFGPGKDHLLRNTSCHECSNGFFVFYGKSFKTTNKKGYQKVLAKFK